MTPMVVCGLDFERKQQQIKGIFNQVVPQDNYPNFMQERVAGYFARLARDYELWNNPELVTPIEKVVRFQLGYSYATLTIHDPHQNYGLKAAVVVGEYPLKDIIRGFPPVCFIWVLPPGYSREILEELYPLFKFGPEDPAAAGRSLVTFHEDQCQRHDCSVWFSITQY